MTQVLVLLQLVPMMKSTPDIGSDEPYDEDINPETTSIKGTTTPAHNALDFLVLMMIGLRFLQKV